MDTATLNHDLDHPEIANLWLRDWGLNDPARGHASLVRIATAGVTLDLLASICEQLSHLLPQSSDPDMALNNLERFISAARSPLALATRFERDRDALPILVQILSTSQYFSELLIADPAAYEVLRLTEGQPVSREALISELSTEVLAVSNNTAVSQALRRFKRRETLRIGYGDIICQQPVEVVTRQISYLADAMVEAAVRIVRIALEQKLGTPMSPTGEPAKFCVLALGKLGGEELNYSSDIDLIFLYDHDGVTAPGGRLSNREFFDRLAREVVKLLSEVTSLGQAYRVDMRLRPEGQRGPLVASLESALHYYDMLGRTWERQAYVKARTVAGDIGFGKEFLKRLEPWIYRRYLGLADITEIKALKRRIEQRAQREGTDAQNVKTGRGGIRDVEFAIQFLQLLNGGDLPQIRTGNTLGAIAALEQVGCLTHQERIVLEENYRFLRKIEHRLQFMFDLQTHVLSQSPAERRALAIRMGYRDSSERTALAAFEADHQTRTERNRMILDHLLHDAFRDDPQTEPEVDLVLDPSPSPEQIKAVLGRYPFRDLEAAYQGLMALSVEKIRFLSARRCRLFLASIAPRLLSAIAATPDPDRTLVNLERVSDSLGGKGVLWELFSFNPPSLRLYVELCASSPYLSGILTSNPGMIDELMDSLVLGKLPTLTELRTSLTELCRAAEDLDPILHSFQNSQVLRVGVRDILGKESIEATTGALTDIAQSVLEQVTRSEYDKLVARFGPPLIAEGDRAGQPCEMAILALGKFGGRELSYHSDLDVVFLFEADGQTSPKRSRKAEVTTNQHFFSELGQRIIKLATRLGPFGRLYDIDARLRPTGRSGSLANSLATFDQYFQSGSGQLWERQALCKARVVYGTPRMVELAQAAAARAAYDHPWRQCDAESIRNMRSRLEESVGGTNLKRGAGGIVDIEFMVQMLQLRHGQEDLSLRVPGTLAALDALTRAGHLSREEQSFFARSYRFLRSVESRLRLSNATTRDELPEDPAELDKLARQLNHAGGEALLAELSQLAGRTRERFEELFAVASH